MGFLDTSNSTSVDNKRDQSVRDDAVKSDNFELNTGALTIGGYGDNELSITNIETAGGAFGFAESANESAAGVSIAALDTVEDVSRDAFGAVEGVSSDAFNYSKDVASDAFGAVEGVSSDALGAVEGVSSDAFEAVNSAMTFGKNIGQESIRSNVSVTKQAMDTIAAGLNSVLSFATDTQKANIEGIEVITSTQANSFSESLESLNRSVSTSISQGNTDVIKYVMIGIAVIGIAFALKG